MDNQVETREGLTREEWRAKIRENPEFTELTELDIEHIIAITFGDLPTGDCIDVRTFKGEV